MSLLGRTGNRLILITDWSSLVFTGPHWALFPPPPPLITFMSDIINGRADCFAGWPGDRETVGQFVSL